MLKDVRIKEKKNFLLRNLSKYSKKKDKKNV